MWQTETSLSVIAQGAASNSLWFIKRPPRAGGLSFHALKLLSLKTSFQVRRLLLFLQNADIGRYVGWLLCAPDSNCKGREGWKVGKEAVLIERKKERKGEGREREV